MLNADLSHVRHYVTKSGNIAKFEVASGEVILAKPLVKTTIEDLSEIDEWVSDLVSGECETQRKQHFKTLEEEEVAFTLWLSKQPDLDLA